MAAVSHSIPEPMNSSPHHPKVKATVVVSDPTFAAGSLVSGKLEMECRADSGLGIGILMVELFAVQELTSRDHSATSTFLHSKRMFQGPGLPPSNAVQALTLPGEPPLPPHYYQARKGRSTFLFRFPIPLSSPPSISFGAGLAKVRYELRGSVGVYWKNAKTLVVDKHAVDVVDAYPPMFDNPTRMGFGLGFVKMPEAVVIGENGKLWMHGRMVTDVIVAGESACVELQVKNHSAKKNSALTLTLSRTLYLPASATGAFKSQPLQISDTLTTVPFRGAEYIIPPGAEGLANLVFDVPKNARGVRGGTLDGAVEDGESEFFGHEHSHHGERDRGIPRHTESLFEIKCAVQVKLIMGMGSKDIMLEIPVEVVHPLALPSLTDNPITYAQPPPQPMNLPTSSPYTDYNPYYPPPMQLPYLDASQNQVWLPPPPSLPQIPASQTPVGYPYLHQPHDSISYQQPYPSIPHIQPQHYPYPYHPHTPDSQQGQQEQHQQQQQSQQQYQQGNMLHPLDNPIHAPGYPPRPLSAGPASSAPLIPPGLPPPSHHTSLLPLPSSLSFEANPFKAAELEEGKGERAARVSQHLRMWSRNRSVSPQSHRYPLPLPIIPNQVSEAAMARSAYTVSAPNHVPIHLRNLPPPPGLGFGKSKSNLEVVSSSMPQSYYNNKSSSNADDVEGNAIVHSPRPHPQLTPKRSFTHDPVLGGTVLTLKSERVEELEKMAEEVGKRMRDLSGDLISELGIDDVIERAGEKKMEDIAKFGNLNKTLPGPPVPSGKNMLHPPSETSRPRADLYFANQEDKDKKFTNSNPIIPETSPLPSDQAPPTPALHAVLPSRHRYSWNENKNKIAKTNEDFNSKDLQCLKGESGLDALERRLLAEVGTRKLDLEPRKPDVRDILANGHDREQLPALSTMPLSIPIPVKSPEPLHDSAISSLTLAGGLRGEAGLADVNLVGLVDPSIGLGISLGGEPVGGGDESDGDDAEGEADGKTHRAGSGRSRSRSGSRSPGGSNGMEQEGLHRYMAMRGRTEVVNASKKTLHGHRARDKKKERASERIIGKKSSHKEKDKENPKEKHKSAVAKGRVAAWLGRIDPDVPPQEQIIPPSPSVVRNPNFEPIERFEFESEYAAMDDFEFHSPNTPKRDIRGEGEREFESQQKSDQEHSASPNPRSSGFVPLSTFKFKSDSTTLTSYAAAHAQGKSPVIMRDATVMEDARRVQDIWSQLQKTPVVHPMAAPKFLSNLANVAPPMPVSIRTDRQFSPPSNSPQPLAKASKNENGYNNTKQQTQIQNPTPTETKPQQPMSYSAAAKNAWKLPELPKPAPPTRQPPLSAGQPIPPPPANYNNLKITSGPGQGRMQTVFPPPIPSSSSKPEINSKYDIRSARGGRGGKVASVASLWSSGMMSSAGGSSQGPKVINPTKLSNVEEVSGIRASSPLKASSSTTPALFTATHQPPPKKLFSAAVMTPLPVPIPAAPKPQTPIGGINASRPPDFQKRADSRALLHLAPAPLHIQGPKKVQSATSLNPNQANSKEAAYMLQAHQKFKPPASPSPSHSPSPYSLQGKITPTNLSTPSAGTSDALANANAKLPKAKEKTPKAEMPVNLKLNLKSTSGSEPVVSSSHAVPTLSSTASLARPRSGAGMSSAVHGQQKQQHPPGLVKVKSPTASSSAHVTSAALRSGAGENAGGASSDFRTSSSSTLREKANVKPHDLAFGQARLRDLIKKYQTPQ